MGIQGLLPLLKSIHEHRKIHEFNGQTLAVDAYVWLHRGAYGCAPELVKGIPTTRQGTFNQQYVDYAMHRVRLLKHHNITPFIVFDGGPLPAKQGTESSRHKSREEARERAMELSRQGRHSEARDAFVKAVDVTPEMAYQLIKALRAENVSYVVAPYEADAQMAYLERTGIVDGIVTEDSDLLVFGCKKVILKLDSDGNCVCIRRENFARVVDLPLHGWSDKQFREMAMLSGCDYLASIQGLGLKTSHKLLRRHKTVEGVLNALRIKGSHTIPPNYLKDFRTAELAFIHQRVFDPITQQLTHLTPVPESLVDWRDSYVGK
ncbi:PIN domain-like protein [Clavulina sp. PMI_390]|nr:PIN domain-like protein [Clavulina sp. PMI_390]